MGYFTTNQLFLLPSFDPDEMEMAKLDGFLDVLEKSGVGDLLSPMGQEGRPGYNPYRMLATVIYGFAMRCPTLRELETACRNDLRFIYLMGQQRPDSASFCRFINDEIIPNESAIFSLVTSEIVRRYSIDVGDLFLDGTKIEANANKYKFVWKPKTAMQKLTDKANALAAGHGIPKDTGSGSVLLARYLDCLGAKAEEEGIDIGKVEFGSGRRPPQTATDYRSMSRMLQKMLDYEERVRICGPDRNSYYKTDTGSTAMCLKEDYYSGLGSEMHAGYNAQAGVSKGIVMCYLISQERNDVNTLIPFMERYFQLYGRYPERLCADSGYGSLRNYLYLEQEGIGNYVKFLQWEGYVSGKRPALYRVLEDGSIVCLGGRKAWPCSIPGHPPRNRNFTLFTITGCRRCIYRGYCKKSQKRKGEPFRIFEVCVRLELFKQKAAENLLSPKGIELRVNRSAQVEGTFGVIKKDMEYERFRRRGMAKTSAEFMLVCLGYNVRKLMRLISGTAKTRYWEAPPSLLPETFREPRAKILSRKKKRQVGLNEETRKSYKRKRGHAH